MQNLKERIQRLEEENEFLRNSMRNAREIYIGMDGFIPKTTSEGYCLRVIERMYEELCDKPLQEADNCYLDVNTAGWTDSLIQCKRCSKDSVMSCSPGFRPASYPPCECGSLEYRELRLLQNPIA